jgi:hypothetical protein
MILAVVPGSEKPFFPFGNSLTVRAAGNPAARASSMSSGFSTDANTLMAGPHASRGIERHQCV